MVDRHPIPAQHPNMATWKMPPKIKIYEALGCVADGRVRVDDTGASVTSSSGGKDYEVTYDEKTRILSSNDNASYWQGYIGYPGIAYLMKLKLLPFDARVADWLRGIAWKEINTKFKNDWTRTEEFVRKNVSLQEHSDLPALNMHIDEILEALQSLDLQRGSRGRPPPNVY